MTEEPSGRAYLRLVALGALVGVPAALVAALFLAAVHGLEDWLWSDPHWYLVLGLPVVGACVVLAARALLPGDGGHEPLEGIGGKPTPMAHAPGVALAAIGTLAFGAVLGPEGPLIALGSVVGLTVTLVVRLSAQESAVIAGAGSFSAISALFGGPIVGGVMMVESGAAGLGAALLPSARGRRGSGGGHGRHDGAAADGDAVRDAARRPSGSRCGARGGPGRGCGLVDDADAAASPGDGKPSGHQVAGHRHGGRHAARHGQRGPLRKMRRSSSPVRGDAVSPAGWEALDRVQPETKGTVAMFARRRPLLRGAMIGGAGFLAGRNYVDDAIPNGSAAAVALIEHRCALELRDAVRAAGGFHLADAWVHPADLIAVGLLAAEGALHEWPTRPGPRSRA